MYENKFSSVKMSHFFTITKHVILKGYLISKSGFKKKNVD